MMDGGNCSWDVWNFGPAGWCGETRDLGGVVLAEVEGHGTRWEAEAALRAKTTRAWKERQLALENGPPVNTDAGEWEPGPWLVEFALALPFLVAIVWLARWVS